MPQPIQSLRLLPIVLFSVVFLLAACGGGQSSTAGDSGSAANNRFAAPTMPSGNFTSVGQQNAMTSTTSLTQTTQATETTATTDTAASAAPADLTRGENAYVKNKCGDCHGANGEGVAGQGNAIAGTTLPLDEFEAVLRTGRGLGNTHIFGRSAVSPSGMEALYAYVQSLGQ